MGRVTEKKRIKIDHSCADNPVYLNWIGVSGGRNYWLFSKRQNKGVAVASKGEFKPYLPDIENAQGTTFDTGRLGEPRLVIGVSNILAEDGEGLKGLLYSPHVLRLMNPLTWETEGCVWQVVRVVPGTFKLWDTDQTRVSLELTIELVELNLQST